MPYVYKNQWLEENLWVDTMVFFISNAEHEKTL